MKNGMEGGAVSYSTCGPSIRSSSGRVFMNYLNNLTDRCAYCNTAMAMNKRYFLLLCYLEDRTVAREVTLG